MKASMRQQHLLIDLQEIDTALLRLTRRLEKVPEKVALQNLEEGHKQARAEFFESQKVVEGLQLEISRIASDNKMVSERKDRTSSRLSASVSAKEAAALQEELDTLERRASNLEDQELEVMQQVEDAEKIKAEFQEKLSVFEVEHKNLSDAVLVAEKDVAAERARLTNERDGLSAEIQGDLRAVYERTRERYGMGAAKLVGRVSGGSNMQLDAADLAEVASLADDEIYFCPVSGVILVRGYPED